MKKSVLWSLRLGFSSAQAEKIETLGLEQFLKNSFQTKIIKSLPICLKDSPKTIQEFRKLRKKIKQLTADEQKEFRLGLRKTTIELQKWWIFQMIDSEYPLLENMTCFWHNHFVSTIQKVKVHYWIYQHNMILRENAFGNFKTLTKLIIKSNAMISYLDNAKNQNGSFNENLSRELLELFTLGIGNYSENDIKNGAKALAGLNYGNDHGIYRPLLQNNDTITYLGKTGKFKADELVDIIFEQPTIPYLVTRKLLQWFIEDNPSEEKVKYLGDYFRDVNFEIKPLLLKMFLEEYKTDSAGSKIKDPLRYILQIKYELNLPNNKIENLLFFLKQQGMELFNQPNVKGWEGGNSWLSSQTYMQRNNVADLLCMGKWLRGKNREMTNNPTINLKQEYSTNMDVIKSLTDYLVFRVSPEMQEDMETILKYDFDPSSPNADKAILRLFDYIVKTPEFQIV